MTTQELPDAPIHSHLQAAATGTSALSTSQVHGLCASTRAQPTVGLWLLKFHLLAGAKTLQTIPHMRQAHLEDGVRAQHRTGAGRHHAVRRRLRGGLALVLLAT